ncbi:hypothetical protein [Paenibacillus puerhi]|uniref:hypothetical protein n=1 Tax=Paenibacillus puerhi TaxID=2692622 RepID=UPI00135AEC5A|nr:hypothetical protein [Paenibacillus puerhi]
MWETVLVKDQMEVQMDAGNKAVRVRILETRPAAGPSALELDQSEMFELLHTLLTINRSFHHEGTRVEGSQPDTAPSSVSMFSRLPAETRAIS